MITPRLLVALVLGLLLSGSCTWFISRKMGSHTPPPVVEQKWVAPSRTIQAGELLRADNVELVSWPASVPIDSGFNKPEAVVGRAALFPLGKGQPLSEKYLAPVGTGAGLAWEIPPGMRAIALRSDEVVGVAGFLAPGTHVDVLATLHTDKNPEPTTFIVLQNAQVLAAGHDTKPDPEGKPSTVTVVTLLLNPADAERAVLASLNGSIHFVLRSGTDTAKTDEGPVELTQLLGNPVHPPVVARAPRVSPITVKTIDTSTSVTVETVAGEKISKDTFKVGTK
jgi:pilus assembly protein CpaB